MQREGHSVEYMVLPPKFIYSVAGLETWPLQPYFWFRTTVYLALSNLVHRLMCISSGVGLRANSNYCDDLKKKKISQGSLSVSDSTAKISAVFSRRRGLTRLWVRPRPHGSAIKLLYPIYEITHRNRDVREMSARMDIFPLFVPIWASRVSARAGWWRY